MKPRVNGSREMGEREHARHALRSIRRDMESPDPKVYGRLLDALDDDALALAGHDDLLGRRRARSLVSGEYARGARRRGADSRVL
jgi:hypothetical protein